MQQNSLFRFYMCPICNGTYRAAVPRNVDNHMIDAFPTTYGKGMLICDGCLLMRLETIQTS
jgi:hypothetical protein